MPAPKFITLTGSNNSGQLRIRADRIDAYEALAGKTGVYIGSETYNVAETPDEIDALIAGRKERRRQGRKQTKRALLVELASRPEGVSLEEMLDAVGWKECRGTLGEACRELGLGLERRDGRYYATQQKAA